MAAIAITKNGSRTMIHVNRLYFILLMSIGRCLPGVELSAIHHVTKTIGFLFLFLLASPIPALITLLTLIANRLRRKSSKTINDGKRILISGGGMSKALQLARAFHAAGHYVVLTEEYSYTAHRFSASVDRFCLCADSDYPNEYVRSIVDIVRRERIQVFVPVSHSTTECLDALVKNALKPLNCETIHGNVEQLDMLSNKYAFIDRSRSLGLTVPKSLRITDPKQVLNFDFSQEKRPFILKPIAYNSHQRDHLVKLPCETREKTADYIANLKINEECPWIMQEFIVGTEYCTHGMVRDGQLQVYACCQSSPWLLNYQHLDNKPKILQWVKKFCADTGISGQASFDFIESEEDGLPYALECNPRTHTAIVTFYNHQDVPKAYLNDTSSSDNLTQPHSTAKEVYWLHHELWNLFKVRSWLQFEIILRRFLYGKEAIYAVDDPLPFLLQYTVHIPRMLIYHLTHMRFYTKIDCNLALLL
jgi:predicted ATP-grasp superfamily ATP-dependent carboligase